MRNMRPRIPTVAIAFEFLFALRTCPRRLHRRTRCETT
jgi:hypothetical protein